MIGAVLGFSAIVRGFFPPETWTIKLVLTVMLFLLTLALLLAGQARERSEKKSRETESTLGRLRSEELIREVRRSGKRDVLLLQSARERAAFLASQIHAFLAEYPPPQAPENLSDDDIRQMSSPALIQYVNASRRYEFQVRVEYQQKYQAEAMKIATELARGGEADESLLVLVHSIAFSGMLKILADRLKMLGRTA